MPSRSPTSAPTFDLPVVSFVPKDFLTNAVQYTAKESSTDYISFYLQVNPASMLPILVRWELVDNSTGLRPTSGFEETNGTVSIGEYRENYKSINPSCMHGGSCISSYSCISHGSSDYCVKNVGPVYETIKVLA